MPPLVLVTGAFGNLGRSVVRRLLREGFRVRAFDLATAANRRVAESLAPDIEVCLGDLTDPGDVARAVAGVDSIAHFAGILPPLSERKPALARAVNLEGTRILADAAAGEKAGMPVVFASSVSVYGPSQSRRGPARADSPTEATDIYTETKLAAEALLRGSDLAWIILRIGASIEGSASATDPVILRLMFEIDPANPVELVHGDDVALAAVRALSRAEAQRRVLLIGGGPSCRITQRRMLELSLGAFGIEGFPDSAFGLSPYYTAWMDSDEAESLLGYRHNDLDRIRADLEARVGRWKPVVRLASPLLTRAMLRFSGPHRGRAPHPTLKSLIDAGY